MEKKKIVCFGELLWRLDSLDVPVSQLDLRKACFVGSEANVAVSLATLGDQVEYITRLPQGEVGEAADHCISKYGVDTSKVIFHPGKIGTYFLQAGASRQKSKTIYDRDDTTYSSLKPGDINWRELFKEAAIFHTSGITAAISKSAADATFEALDVADEMGIPVSFDINYRKALWNYGVDARETLIRMMQRCDMMFGDVIEYEWITERQPIPFEATDSHYKMDFDAYRKWYDELHELCPRCKDMIIGIRNQPAPTHHALTALLLHHNVMYSTVIHDITHVVDPVGVGDAFAAGSIHAAIHFPDDPQRYLDYALAAATLKNRIPGDFNLTTAEEMDTFLKTVR